MPSPHSPAAVHPHLRVLRGSSAGVASHGRVASPAPSSRRGLWPGEATLLAAAVLWVLVLLYAGIGEWRRMVQDARTDMGEWGER
jgi:ferric-dicitrate binding protein FerR (iron transport regulator)